MKNNRLVLLTVSLLFAVFSYSAVNTIQNERPKLIIGIVVDQMTYDFIPRYWSKYSDYGFRKIINDGFFCKNVNHSHVPTYTAVGHTCIYTGTVPSVNGICANDWVDSGRSKYRYCAYDSTVHAVGSSSDNERMSPSSLLTNTITDELRISSDYKSRVIGIALKDRGGIFPAGRKGNAAYWYDEKSFNWISSSYYMNSLPEWVSEFNSRGLPDKYLNSPWNTMLPVEQYTESTPDDNEFEDKFKGEEKPVFPHDLPALKIKNPAILRYTPFGNTLTKEFAVETIRNENLGLGDHTDFLCVSFSSTDYIGHKFGPNSIEVEDTYLRLDGDISELISYAENLVGKENLLIFLTADHGVCGNPQYLTTQNQEAGTFFYKAVLDSVNSFLTRNYSVNNLALYFMNQQVFLDRSLIKKSGIQLNEVSVAVADYMKKHIPGVKSVFTAEELKNGNSVDPYFEFFKNGFYESRCGEVFVNFRQYWIEDRIKGSEHGSPYEYDTHVPLIWYGWKIPKGETSEPLKIVDIVPTLAYLLGISPPEGCMGKPVRDLIENVK